MNVSLEKAMRHVFLSLSEDVSDATEVIRILLRFHSSLSTEELAGKLHCHVSVLRRWIAGTVPPDVEIIFKLMDLRPNLLTQFVARIVPIRRITTLASRHVSDALEFHDESTSPQLLLVQLCLGLKEYQDLPAHDDGLIARIANMPEEEVRTVIHRLIDQQKIKWSAGKLVPDLKFLNTHGDQTTISRMQRFWTSHSLARLSTPEGIPSNLKRRPNLQCASVVTVSKEGMKRIAEKFHACFEEAIQLVNTETAPAEEIRVLILDMFSPDDLPEPIRGIPVATDRTAPPDKESPSDVRPA